MKIDYVNSKKGTNSQINTSEISVDLENGYTLRLYEANWGLAIQVVGKNSRKKVLDKLVDDWIGKLKGENANDGQDNQKDSVGERSGRTHHRF